MQTDFYGVSYLSAPEQSPALGSARLGLEEGQVRLTCSPGMVKVYLQEFPWEKCVPEGQIESAAPYEVLPPPEPYEALPPPEPLPLPEPLPPVSLPEPAPLPPPEPKVAPPAPEAPRPPGKARFLDVDPESGALLDPDTGRAIHTETVLALTPMDTGITVAAGLLVTGVVLTALGVFGGR